MNVYDFDKTVFYPDCTCLFIRWCLHRHPGLLLTYLPKTLFYALLYALNNVGKDYVEEKLFSFIVEIDDLEQEVQAFGDANQSRKQAAAQKRRRLCPYAAA